MIPSFALSREDVSDENDEVAYGKRASMPITIPAIRLLKTRIVTAMITLAVLVGVAATPKTATA